MATILSQGSEQGPGEKLDRDVPEKLTSLSRPHIESFDYFIEKGINEAVARLDSMEIVHPGDKKALEMWFDNLVVHKPVKEYKDASDIRLFPNECREGGLTYRGKLTADICYRVGDGPVQKFSDKTIGSVPIMVRSSRCHLQHLTQKELVARKEEALEFGGYFIVNGIEKLIRLLIVPRRNFVMALKRSAYLNRGPAYTDKATVIRCARPDQSTMTTRVHYLVDGNANVAFTLRRQEFFIPIGIVLKCLVEASDKEIYERLIAGGGSHFVAQRAELILREVHRYSLRTRAECLAFLGERFRALLDYPARLSDRAAGQKLLDDNVLVHLERPQDKFNLLVFMLHKLYALVDGGCCDDNADALVHHELLLPGHLLTMFLKERLQEYLQRTKAVIEKDLRENKARVNFSDSVYLKKALDKNGVDIGKKLNYFLATGNLVTQSGLDLQQTSGFTIVAERLNYLRYVSHFRSVHRGAYFAQLRTTTVRKLLPESWGFMCPVHTPDGSPCGLLMHLTMHCQVVTTDRDKESDAISARLANTLLEMGMLPASTGLVPPSPPSHLAVMQDGRLIGTLRATAVEKVVEMLRTLKTEVDLPADLEIAHIAYEEGGPFPGVFIATTPARMIRPVLQLSSGKVEMIGPLEQMYMDIRCPDGVEGGGTDLTFTHQERHPTTMLSMVANLTPWSDYNQSPRNMYQCQMGKQTMGVPYHANNHRPDTKTYRLQTPQKPIARTGTYGDYMVDDYPLGTNAVVAVLAYTGYDMEDAMIINKSSMERGLCHGTMFKTETIDLKPLRARGDAITTGFGRGPKRVKRTPEKPGHEKEDFIDVDGLPHVGQTLTSDDPYVSAINKITQQEKLTKLKGSENAVVDQVTLIGSAVDEQLQQVSVKLRYNRNPVIGDKFSSRHGQKGVLSQLWPDVDMPFAAMTGMRPDIIINPHAFPSRMTIGMLVESMAAKAGALRGEFVDATPFKSSVQKQDKNVVDQFGEQLAAAGFNYYGNETMYSGVLGTELTAHIYMGVVYYQRLRHMVSDKFQVRSVGPVNNLTHQPVKGRKAGGGIRFGEMERDSLLSHGAAFLLHDRLHASSDYHTTDVCSTCGSLLSTQSNLSGTGYGLGGQLAGGLGAGRKRKVECRVCGTSRGVERVAMPYVFKFLAAELAAMNIKVKLTLSD